MESTAEYRLMRSYLDDVQELCIGIQAVIRIEALCDRRVSGKKNREAFHSEE